MCLGTPGRIVRYEDDARHVATVDFAGTERSVNMGMVAEDADPPGPGDWVLVHLGIALQRMASHEVTQRQTYFDDLLAEFEQAAAAREAPEET